MPNKILNVPHHEEEHFKADLYRSIINERQRDGNFNMGASSDSDTPEDDLDAKRKYIRDKVIFTHNALKGNAMMYVYEDPDHRIHVSDLAILVMELLEAGLTREKAKAEVEANQKKKEL
jgi:hypothetical protein